MITVQFLQNDDVIDPEDWCRPLQLVTMSGGMSDSMSHKSMYSGTPENNVRWVKVKDVIGPRWKGCTKKEVNSSGFTPYEFVRGDVPPSHQLDMDHYNSYADLWEN